jgi:hypothetical protein
LETGRIAFTCQSTFLASFFPLPALDFHSKSIQIPTTVTNITPQQLRKAADLQEKILELQDELNEILGGEVPTSAQATEAPRKKYKFSAASRAKMRSAQKARWAKIKGTAPSEEPAPKKKRKLSAEGLANIRAGVAKRWAAKGKAVKKPKRKMTAAWRAALERAWEARRGKAALKSRA